MAARRKITGGRHTAAIVLVGTTLSVAGCAGGTREAAAPSAPDPAGPAQAAARSVWGLVPDAPAAGRGADVASELVRGSAVAVSENTLLASCRAVGDRRSVGLVRADAYRVATVAARDLDGQVCALRVGGDPLSPVLAFRTLDDLRVGEPVVALANQTSADLALTRGWLAATSAEPEPFLETTLVLPAGALSGVLFDAQGNLIGLGSAGPTPDAYTLAAPVADPLAPRLAAVEIGASEAVEASLESDPEDAASPPPLWLTLDSDRGGDGGRLTAVPLIGGRTVQGARPAAASPDAAPVAGAAPVGAAGSLADAGSANATGLGNAAQSPAGSVAADAPSPSDSSAVADGAAAGKDGAAAVGAAAQGQGTAARAGRGIGRGARSVAGGSQQAGVEGAGDRGRGPGGSQGAAGASDDGGAAGASDDGSSAGSGDADDGSASGQGGGGQGNGGGGTGDGGGSGDAGAGDDSGGGADDSASSSGADDGASSGDDGSSAGSGADGSDASGSGSGSASGRGGSGAEGGRGGRGDESGRGRGRGRGGDDDGSGRGRGRGGSDDDGGGRGGRGGGDDGGDDDGGGGGDDD